MEKISIHREFYKLLTTTVCKLCKLIGAFDSFGESVIAAIKFQ